MLLVRGEPFTFYCRGGGVPSQDNAEGYISRNEMSSDYVNVSFFKWKGFHGTFIEQGNSLHVAANIINETNVSG